MADTKTYEIRFTTPERPPVAERDTIIRIACTTEEALQIFEEIEEAGFIVGQMTRRDAMSMDDWQELRPSIFVEATMLAVRK